MPRPWMSSLAGDGGEPAWCPPATSPGKWPGDLRPRVAGLLAECGSERACQDRAERHPRLTNALRQGMHHG
jgi:hypothetical protein